MKKLYSILFAGLLLSGGVAFAYNDGGNVNIKESSGGSAADPVRVYQLVRWADISAAQSNPLSAGDVVVWDCISDDGVTVGLVGTVGPANSTDAVAGVVVSTTIPSADMANTAAGDIGHRNWGYIQTYGFSSNCMISSANGTLIVGEGLIPSATARYAVGRSKSDSVSGNYGVFAFAYDATSATSNGNEVFVKNR